MGFTPIVQLRPHLLTGTPFSTDLSASYSELIGQLTTSHTIVLTTSGMSASEIVAPLVIRTGATEIVPLLVALTNPPTVGALQAQVRVTAALVATTSSVPAPMLQTQTASLPRASIEGQPDSSESEEDTSQFLITPRSSAPNTTASVPPSDP
jgi:hypothetical protein